jgi:hypothetical protein
MSISFGTAARGAIGSACVGAAADAPPAGPVQAGAWGCGRGRHAVSNGCWGDAQHACVAPHTTSRRGPRHSIPTRPLHERAPAAATGEHFGGGCLTSCAHRSQRLASPTNDRVGSRWACLGPRRIRAFQSGATAGNYPFGQDGDSPKANQPNYCRCVFNVRCRRAPTPGHRSRAKRRRIQPACRGYGREGRLPIRALHPGG